jgi:DNA-binding CsgD family transcriptional regulator
LRNFGRAFKTRCVRRSRQSTGLDLDLIRGEAELITSPSVGVLLRRLRQLGMTLTQADDVEIALMEIPDPEKPGRVLYYEGSANYTPEQIPCVNEHSFEHPLFKMSQRVEMTDVLELDEANGTLGWRSTRMNAEVREPCSVRRALFACLGVADGFTLTIKAVRHSDKPFEELARVRLIHLQNVARALLRRCDLLQELCHALAKCELKSGLARKTNFGPDIFGLTTREAQVLQWVEVGKQDCEIASILGVSPRTIHTHVSALLRKLRCENRLQLIASRFGSLFAVENGGSPVG